MRVLIIALPRTGSTSLLKKLSKQYKLKSLFEPFIGASKYDYSDTLKNIVVKTMMYHLPPKSDNVIDGYIQLSSKFDEVTLLSRRNLNECAESWAYLQEHNRPNIMSGFNSIKHYIWDPPSDDKIQKALDFVVNLHSELEKISEVLNIPITYYEDIYDVNSHEKYRKNNTITKII